VLDKRIKTWNFFFWENGKRRLGQAVSAEIRRINKGLKRRANQTVFGFYFDPRSGYWAKSDDEDPDVDGGPAGWRRRCGGSLPARRGDRHDVC